MFSKNVARTDAFLDMSQSAQNLYFHLGIDADDDGFVSPKMVMRMLGSTQDDLKNLIGKGFVIPFEDGVVVIRHWKVNNEIRQDRYKETQYITHKSKLSLNSGIYDFSELVLPLVNQKDDIRDTQYRLGKDRLGKDSTDTSPKGDDDFNVFWEKYPRKIGKQEAIKAWNKLKPTKELIDLIVSSLEKHKKSSQWVRDNGQFIPHPSTWLNQRRFEDELPDNKPYLSYA